MAGEPGERRVMFALHNWWRDDDNSKRATNENYRDAFWQSTFLYVDGAIGDRKDVFLTNVLVQLRKGSAVGDIVGQLHANEVEHSRHLFALQLELINPLLVVVCGLEPNKGESNAYTLLREWGYADDSRFLWGIAHPSGFRNAKTRLAHTAKYVARIRTAWEAIKKASAA